MKITAKLKNYRRSPKKIREVANLLKGVQVDEAIYQLNFIKKGFADDLAGLIRSAIANAENNFKIAKDNLYIANVLVEKGPVLKRWRARAYGRAAQILKRSSHIIVELEERQVEVKKSTILGKNFKKKNDQKSKEKIEKDAEIKFTKKDGTKKATKKVIKKEEKKNKKQEIKKRRLEK